MDLIPNGRNTMVTDHNKLEYVQRITHHRMTHSIRGQIEAFLEGEVTARLATSTASLPFFLVFVKGIQGQPKSRTHVAADT